uniref:Caveolin n=1 Tax=Heterorhabditis bacteriophora TaxID=37862 RepID=A0A1I7WVB3_HETBA
MHKGVHDELTTYVNRTHQIAKELKNAMDENYPVDNKNNTDKHGRQWMTVEELDEYATLIRETNSTVWCLFCWNIALALLLLPVLIVIHCNIVDGNLAKLIYRAILVACLLLCVAQLLYFIHPVLWGAVKFPAMVDRLFIEAYPRDEYQINEIKDRFACEFDPHHTLVQFDIQVRVMENRIKITSSLYFSF